MNTLWIPDNPCYACEGPSCLNCTLKASYDGERKGQRKILEYLKGQYLLSKSIIDPMLSELEGKK